MYKISGYTKFTYPEEEPSYEIPKEYLDTSAQIVLEWDEKDPEFPRNWPLLERLFVQVQMTILTFCIYMGGPIYTAAIDIVMDEFNVGYIVATLPLCTYIFGYGVTQLFFSPMSEQANIGRTPIYTISGILFVLLQIPCGLTTNFVGLNIARFLAGAFASPALSVGAATYGDVTPVALIPPALAAWGAAAFCGPSIGPLIGIGLLKSDWRNIFWFLLAINGGITVLLFTTSPETNSSTLLLWKAQRLRRITGNQNIVAPSELSQSTLAQNLVVISWRTFQIMALEPMVLAVDLYQGLCYGCLYLWFEGFPIVYGETYNFSPTGVAITYITIIVGVLIGGTLYILMVHKRFSLVIMRGEEAAPEVFLDISLVGCILLTLSLFFFGWTASPKIHWVVSIVAAAIFGAGSICVLQSNLNYLGMLYPRYIASIFGGNGLIRSALGGSFPIYGKSLFLNLAIEDFPVAWGCSLLGFIFLGLTFIPLVFKKFKKQLFKNSRFAGP